MAAFVSPTSPEVLEFSKYVTGMARSSRRTGLNQNMQFGLWLFEGLRSYGINVPARGEVQFPAQTLAYKSGTALDMGLLYAAALEAAGISCALIPFEDDAVVLIGLGIGEAAAATLFNGTEKLLIVNDEMWLPLSMNAPADGFTAAWENAVSELNDAFEAEAALDFIIFEDAWAAYPPAPFPALGVTIVQPDPAGLRSGADGAINQYIAAEIEPLVQAVQAQIRSSPTAALYNRLGILQVRAGRQAEAKAAYERAAGMGSAAGMTNRANLALGENDYAAAERWFRQALQVQPDNAAALRGLEQISNR
jgi:tetratricopeptide (TPR) repeat protein